MRVEELMQTRVFTCAPTDHLRHAGEILGRIGAGVLPVVDHGALVGIVTDRDMFLATATRDARPSEITLEEIMTREVETCRADEQVLHAMARMERCGLRRLPVVDDEGRVVGILSLDDVAASARATGDPEYQGTFYSNIARTLQASVRARADRNAGWRRAG
ncbi:MAG: CBS domain-containing protein [Thermoanaerobaculia bacterium]